MPKAFYIFVFFVLLGNCQLVFSQDKIDFTDIESDDFLMFSNADKNLFEDAIAQIKEYEYINALPILETLHKNYPDHVYVKYVLAICQMADPNKEEIALANLRDIEGHKSKLHFYDFILAKCLEKNEKYAEAINEFETFLSSSKDELLNASAVNNINYCKNELNLKNKLEEIQIKNIGNLTNSENSEYAPAIPADGSFMIFTYRGVRSVGGKQVSPGIKSDKGKYFEDVFIVHKNDSGIWTKPEPIKEINTTGHDACVSISSDGQKIYLYRNTGVTGGDIYESNLKGVHWSEPVKVNGINSKYWEGSACISPYGKVIIFSSERPGGIGGKDLYKADLDKNGHWINIKNLGPTINTKEDEDAPFISAEFKYLYFSSNGHESYGGYDIFRSEYNDGEFSKPYHLDKPLNSVNDEIYYVVAANGKQGYYSSDKKNGFGQQDIYLVEPGISDELPVLAMVKGVVLAEGKPVQADITLENTDKNVIRGIFVSNSKSGQYLITLRTHIKYKITYSTPGFKNKVELVDLSNMKAFMEIAHEVNFEKNDAEMIQTTKTIQYQIDQRFPRLKEKNENVSDTIIKNKSDLVATEKKIISTLGDSSSKEICDCKKFEGKDLNNKTVYNSFINDCGKTKQEGLVFKVQIGAYKHPENFKYDNVKDIGEVVAKPYEDGITRFTMKEFITLEEAEVLRQQCIAKGIKDAWVVAFFEGKRTMLEDLIKKNFFKEKNS